MPYTYLIGWTKENKWYYGSRYSKYSTPDDLWVSYFTSSRYVDEMRKLYGELDVIQIRRVFDDPHKAQQWEIGVLRRMNVLFENKWLNKNVGGRIYIEKQTSEHIKKRTQNKNTNPNQKQHALNAAIVAAEKRRGTTDSEETRKKRSDTLKKTYQKERETVGKIERPKRAIFLIDGVIYNGIEAVMDAFGVTMPTVYNRVKNEKFKNWTRINNG